MKKFSMTCSCADTMTVAAENREEAVAKLKEMMTADAIAAHCAEKHPDQPAVSVEACHAEIDANTVEMPEEAPAM